MYAIISKGELLALCERPRYVKRNEETGAYVEAAEAEAIGIAVGGEVYNLPGGTAIPDAPEALAQEGEAEEYVFRNHARIIENEEATNAAFAAVEEAIRSIPHVAGVEFISKDQMLDKYSQRLEGYTNLKEMFQNDNPLLANYVVRADEPANICLLYTSDAADE